MTTLKDNPHALLKKEGISEKMLSADVLHFLQLFDKAEAMAKKHPAAEGLHIIRINAELKNEVEETEKKVIKKAQSKKIVEKSSAVLDDLSLCREKLKEERKRKLASGEIPPRKKKTLVTKLRGELLKTVSLIPKNLKEDASVLERTQRVILKFLHDLKSIWGLNKIKPIEEEVKEKFKKLEENAA